LNWTRSRVEPSLGKPHGAARLELVFSALTTESTIVVATTTFLAVLARKVTGTPAVRTPAQDATISTECHRRPHRTAAPNVDPARALAPPRSARPRRCAASHSCGRRPRSDRERRAVSSVGGVGHEMSRPNADTPTDETRIDQASRSRDRCCCQAPLVGESAMPLSTAAEN
jgi:hypothetical protein